MSVVFKGPRGEGDGCGGDVGLKRASFMVNPLSSVLNYSRKFSYCQIYSKKNVKI